MGLFDNIVVEDNEMLPEYEGPEDPGWQTKTVEQPHMTTYRITEDGRLERKEQDYREKTDEEKAEEAEEHGFDSWEAYKDEVEHMPLDEKFDHGYPTILRESTLDETYWVDHNQHGSFEFHTSLPADDGDDTWWWSYEARFTKGDLDEIVLLEKEKTGNEWKSPVDLEQEAFELADPEEDND